MERLETENWYAVVQRGSQALIEINHAIEHHIDDL